MESSNRLLEGQSLSCPRGRVAVAAVDAVRGERPGHVLSCSAPLTMRLLPAGDTVFARTSSVKAFRPLEAFAEEVLSSCYGDLPRSAEDGA